MEQLSPVKRGLAIKSVLVDAYGAGFAVVTGGGLPRINELIVAVWNSLAASPSEGVAVHALSVCCLGFGTRSPTQPADIDKSPTCEPLEPKWI
jgi:hypothetical protein